MVTFSEFPEEISLCVNITNCPLRCRQCHSMQLWKDIGKPLTTDIIDKLLKANDGITLIGLMGGDREPWNINSLAAYIKHHYQVKVGWYSGRNVLHSRIDINNFDVIKLGSYNYKLGGLDNPNTNQRYYKIIDGQMMDSTKLFWKNA